jgi:GMP reductase
MDYELSYRDIQLIPKFCIVGSRKECDTSVQLGNRKFRIPVVPANMKTIITEKLSCYLAQKNYFYIMHRFGTDIVEFVKNMNQQGLYSSISVGVNADSYEQLRTIKNDKLTVDYIVIDIAHGFSKKMEPMIGFIKEQFPNTFLIAGNVATGEAAQTLERWGADCIKVGVANGSVCITRNKTGFGRPSVAALVDCCAEAKKPIIADGGLEYFGDTAKALTLGATLVMSGHFFAGHDETFGGTIELDDKIYKEYYGSASQYSKNEHRNIEGRKKLVNYKGPIEKTLIEIEEDLQSSISYAGGKDLSAFHTVKWVKARY